MSFGAAASASASSPDERFPRIAADHVCPCGGGEPFDGCCRPLLRGQPAPSAERLMRSRYTAFVVGDARYLAETWHPGTRPDDLDLDPAQRWTGLEILAVEAGGPDDAKGVVEFRAHWSHGRAHEALHERSRFVRQSGRWWYLDGNVS